MNLKTNPTLATFSILPFEHGCHNLWLTRDSSNISHLDDELVSWLFDQDSLTQRLQSHCKHFQVRVLREGLAQVSPQEQQLFPACDAIYSREVLLICDGKPQVYARTLIPQTTLSYANSLLRDIGNTSLGEVLFRAKNMQRHAIEITEFEQNSIMAKFANELTGTAPHPLWARRSMFTLDDNPLNVSEVFLPGSFAYNNGRLL